MSTKGYGNHMKGKTLLLCAPSALISLRVKARRRIDVRVRPNSDACNRAQHASRPLTVRYAPLPLIRLLFILNYNPHDFHLIKHTYYSSN
jgi:hypothetical protein